MVKPTNFKDGRYRLQGSKTSTSSNPDEVYKGLNGNGGTP